MRDKFVAVLESAGYAVSESARHLVALNAEGRIQVTVRLTHAEAGCGWVIEDDERRIASGVFVSSLAQALERLKAECPA